MVVQRLTLIVLAALGLCGLLGCGEPQAPIPKDAIVIRGAGATFPAPLYKHWITEFQKAHDKVIIDYEAVGSGEGIKRFMNESVMFGASDAAMNDEQIASVKRGAHLIPATAGIIVLAYNLKGVDALKLTREVYVDIFLGDIKKWNDPRIQKSNPDAQLPNQNIVIVARRDSSGTTYAFTNHLSAVSTKWRDRGPGIGKVVDWPGNAMTAKGNEGVAGRIKISDGSIGYVEFGFADRAELSMAALENKAGRFTRPLCDSGAATLQHHAGLMPDNLRIFFPDPDGESSYPIVTYSWLLVYENYANAEKWKHLKAFIKYGLTQGQAYSAGHGYCRLPDQVVKLALAKLDQIQ